MRTTEQRRHSVIVVGIVLLLIGFITKIAIL